MWNEFLGARLWRWFAALALAAAPGSITAHRPPSALSIVIDRASHLDHRVTEARLFGLPHAEFAVSRGRSTQPLTTRGAAAEMLLDPKIVSDPHAHGIALLLAGNVDAAVATLEAAAHTPADAALLTDLAAARYEQGRRHNSPEAFAHALAASHRAMRLDPRSAAALFNRALALDALHLTSLAIRAFNEYLDVDPDSEWAVEARTRLAALPRTTIAAQWKERRRDLEQACNAGRIAEVTVIVKTFPVEARRWGEGPYLTDWARATFEHRDSGEPLAITRCIGKALERTSGERLLTDVVAAIDKSVNTAIIADGLRTYQQARVAYSEGRYDDALPLLKRASQQLAACGSPMYLLASYYETDLLVNMGRSTDALSLIDEIDGRSKRSYIALHAQLQWARALAFGRLGHVYEVLETAKDSAETFERLGELESAARMRTSISAALTVLGRDSEAWANRREALRVASASGNGDMLDSALANTIRDELRQSHFDVGWAFATEAVGVATSPIARTEALLWQTVASSQEPSGSPPDFAPVLAAASAIHDYTARQGVLDNIRFAEAKLIADREPAKALSLLDTSVDYRTRTFPYTLPEAWVTRARSLLALGRSRDANADLDKAIEVLDRQRKSITDPLMRESYSGNDDSIYDVAQLVAMQEGDYERVFAVSELSRGTLMGAGNVIANPRAIAAQLPPEYTLVHLTTTTTSIVATSLTHSSTRFVVIPVGREQVARMGRNLTNAIVNGDADWKDTSRAVYDTLLTPIRQDIASAGVLIISPDQSLTAIPYAALIDPATNRFLIQDHAVALTPSASAWAAGHRASHEHAPRALLVGDPLFDTRLFPQLPSLPGAREEISALASLYPNAVQLVGPDATVAAILPLLDQSDVVHIAAHAIPNERDVASSVIVLSPSRSNTGLLYAGDVARFRFSHAPLVFLAGCGTAATSEGRGSIRTIAAAFLTAGSSNVIGTLWDVEDTRSRDVSIAFHRALSRGESPINALRDVQLALLTSNVQPREWAAFQTYTTR